MPAYCVGLDISETSSSSKELWMASAIHLCRVFMFTSKLPRLSGAMSWCSSIELQMCWNIPDSSSSSSSRFSSSQSSMVSHLMDS